MMEPITWALVTTFFTGGAAFGGVKVALNGTRERVRKLEDINVDHQDRLARMETKIDYLVDTKTKQD